jgi:CO dehydrogenase/acetyl-CoA synthase beta subunit
LPYDQVIYIHLAEIHVDSDDDDQTHNCFPLSVAEAAAASSAEEEEEKEEEEEEEEEKEEKEEKEERQIFEFSLPDYLCVCVVRLIYKAKLRSKKPYNSVTTHTLLLHRIET